MVSDIDATDGAGADQTSSQLQIPKETLEANLKDNALREDMTINPMLSKHNDTRSQDNLGSDAKGSLSDSNVAGTNNAIPPSGTGLDVERNATAPFDKRTFSTPDNEDHVLPTETGVSGPIDDPKTMANATPSGRNGFNSTSANNDTEEQHTKLLKDEDEPKVAAFHNQISDAIIDKSDAAEEQIAVAPSASLERSPSIVMMSDPIEMPKEDKDTAANSMSNKFEDGPTKAPEPIPNRIPHDKTSSELREDNVDKIEDRITRPASLNRNANTPSPPLSRSNTFAGRVKNDVCIVCLKVAYPLEKVDVNGKPHHKTCFRCEKCNNVLKLGSFATSPNGAFYCKPHFKELFRLKGNYSEGFGEEQHKHRWTRDTVQTDSQEAPESPAVPLSQNAQAVQSPVASTMPSARSTENVKWDNSVATEGEPTASTEVEYANPSLLERVKSIVTSPRSRRRLSRRASQMEQITQISPISPSSDGGLKKGLSDQDLFPSVDQSRRTSRTDADGQKLMKSGVFLTKIRNDTCEGCQKTVYAQDKITVNTKPFHKYCFKCEHCHSTLKLGSFAAAPNGKFYCRPHFKELFRLKGNYSEGFGEVQHKNKWLHEQGTSSTSMSLDTSQKPPLAIPKSTQEETLQHSQGNTDIATESKAPRPEVSPKSPSIASRLKKTLLSPKFGRRTTAESKDIEAEKVTEQAPVKPQQPPPKPSSHSIENLFSFQKKSSSSSNKEKPPVASKPVSLGTSRRASSTSTPVLSPTKSESAATKGSNNSPSDTGAVAIAAAKSLESAMDKATTVETIPDTKKTIVTSPNNPKPASAANKSTSALSRSSTLSPGLSRSSTFLAKIKSEPCEVCKKTVYPLDKMSINQKSYHQACFKCEHCDGKLKLNNFAAAPNGSFYCKPHFKELFRLKGNYSEGFGEEQHKNKWVKKDDTGASDN